MIKNIRLIWFPACLLCWIAFTSLAVMQVHAQSRSNKEMKTFINQVKKADKTGKGMGGRGRKYMPAVVTSRDNYSFLNEIERDMLKRYSSFMVVPTNLNFYVVYNQKHKAGLCNVDGEEILPCKYTIISLLKQFILAQTKIRGISEVSQYDGIFSSDASVIIPCGKYDGIELESLNRGFEVFIYDDRGRRLWGACDLEGREILSCNWKSVYLKGKNWYGSNFSRQELAAMAAEKQAKRDAIIGAVTSGLLTIASSLEQKQSVGMNITTGTTSDSSISGNYQQQYEKWTNIAEKHYHSLVNTGASIEHEEGVGGVTGGAGHLSSANYGQMKKALREAQQQMKKIRMLAQKNGINIVASKWETAVVRY